MKQLKVKIFFLFFTFILFFPFIVNARIEDCSIRKNGVFDTLTFPPGGGYNNDLKVSLPIGSGITISSAEVELSPKNVIGTPYIWVPKSVTNGQIVQIDTATGAIIDIYSVGNNPSRVTVMPGGDVWVANRDSGNLTRLSPAVSPKYSVNGTYSVGNGPRGVTFDYKGNIWAFDYYDTKIYKFTAPDYTSSSFDNTMSFPYIYGAIGDAYGYVWMVGDANSQSGGTRQVNILNTKTNEIILAEACAINSSTYIYGIGMDNQGNILVANYGGGGYCKIGGVKSGTNFGKIIQKVVQSGVTGSRGIAVDGNNNIWVANSINNHIYVFNSVGILLKDLVPGTDFGNYTDMVGVAIDFDNNAWVVSNGSGRVLKFGAVGSADQYSVIYDINIGGPLYNYSDMTGFRSIPTSMSIGSCPTCEFFPQSGTSKYTGFGPVLKAALLSCSCPDAKGDNQCVKEGDDMCSVPLSLFSVTGGNYEAKNLNIVCSQYFAPIIGGLVPCGRLDNEVPAGGGPDLIDESAPCTICAMFYMLKNIINFIMELSIGVGIFILVIAGLLYATSVGDSHRIELAKSAINSVVSGIAIIFIAWLAIAVVLQAMGYANVGTWYQVSCS